MVSDEPAVNEDDHDEDAYVINRVGGKMVIEGNQYNVVDDMTIIHDSGTRRHK